MTRRPIIIGAGPAGCAAAIDLSRGGATPLLIDRDATAGDPICGGFLSWQTASRLRTLGFDPLDAGAPEVRRLALFAGRSMAEATLPAPGYGLSRQTMDGRLRELAIAQGVPFQVDRIRTVTPGRVEGETATYDGDAIFLATGKTDVRGIGRARDADDPALGLRIHCRATDKLARLVSDGIELHLFAGGYAGIVLQENGRANICLALRKSLLLEAGGNPRSLLDRLAENSPRFADRLAEVPFDVAIDTIAAVPYGWRARDTEPGLFRLGDQAAVIPSLAGEGMGIALASARMASDFYRVGGVAAASSYQRRFFTRSRRPVAAAELLWKLGETELGARLLRRATSTVPALAHLAMRLSRI
ncbi:FAD-dependent oxidoreductase [Sphingomicrobium sp. XHP0239]|uniref:NAD(P)/FAD-dependent oxidoreductase n=1 Tax=Sphingomicrobium maritimum TaxID=3133972 RepID=UPI0031CC9E6C